MKIAMFQSSSIQVDKWNNEQVSAWIKGLDGVVCDYHSNFLQNAFNGRRLGMIDHNDLTNLGVKKVGHQEILLDAVELLKSLANEINSCNLQSLALVVTCRISNLHRILEQHDITAVLPEDYEKRMVDAVYYLVQSLKEMISWLGSAPFVSMEEFTTLHDQIARATLSVIKLFSRSNRVCSLIQTVTEHRSYILNKLAEIEKKCDDLVKNGGDPMILTPASIETVTVRKRADEPLGIQLQSTHRGVHTIKLIRQNTACENSKRLEPGDQIIQVNGQSVVGWQLKNVVSALKEKPKEVTLSIKKSPRHFSLQAFNRRPSPKNVLTLGENLKQSTLPKRLSKHGSEDGSFDGKLKSSSIGEPPATVHTTSDIPSPSAFDDVFSPSSTDTDSIVVGLTPPVLYDDSPERRSTMNGDVSKPRPVILVNDKSMPSDLPCNPAEGGGGVTVTTSGKKEILSTFHVVKSTPELRTPDNEQDVNDMWSNPNMTDDGKT